jgi:hypothetical protein
MAALLIPQRHTNPNSLFSFYPELDPKSFKELNQLDTGSLCTPDRAYFMVPGNTPKDDAIYSYVKNISGPSIRALSQAQKILGPDLLLAISDLFDDLTSDKTQAISLGTSGGTIGAINSRAKQFNDALMDLQNAMQALRHVSQDKSLTRLAKHKAEIRLKVNVEKTVKRLNIRFKDELSHRITKIKSRRGLVYTDSQRAIRVAKDGRQAKQILQITELPELKKALHFSNAAKFAGNSLIALDVVNRGSNVIHSFAKNDGSGYRTMFKESSTVALSGLSGMAIGGLADGIVTGSLISNLTGGLIAGLALGPVGWVFVIGAGIAA